MKVTLLGAGAYASALANLFSPNVGEVFIYDPLNEVVEEINSKRTNSKYLSQINFKENIRASANLSECVKDAHFLLFVPASQYVLPLLEQVKELNEFKEAQPLIGCASKGLIEEKGEVHTLLSLMEEQLGVEYKDSLIYISGPTHAEELAQEIYSGLMISSKNKDYSKEIQKILSNDFLRTYTSQDVTGAQVSAALKNIIAIFYGLCDALRETDKRIGDNTEAYLFSRGLVEIYELAQSFGEIEKETFLNICSAGDLFVTCTSHHGRNRRFGREIITQKLLEKNFSLEELLQNLDYLPEGVYTLLALEKNIRVQEKTLALMNMLLDVLLEKKDSSQALEEYMKSVKED